MKNYIKYFIALLLFGSNGIVASHITLSSYEIVYLRTFIGSLLLIVLFKLSGGKFHVKSYKRDSVFIVISGIAMGMSWMFLYEAYQQIGVSFSSLLYYCGPVIVMALSPVIFRERFTMPKIIGFVIVLIGIILVNGQSMVEDGNNWGLFCGFMSAVMYSAMVICNKQSKNITGMENSVIQLSISFLTVAIFTIIRQGILVQISTGEIPWILFLGLINTGLGCYLYFSPLNKLPVQTVAVCGYLEPLSAVVLSAVILGERMTGCQMIGAGCIIGGAMMGELLGTKKA
ncbi:MAG: DMT family transporter [Bacteroidales bacterium]|nr:DMT family transporter [Lachnoclostridium sp.]MCM1383406.1 DMT family transporter [Lachnoclostridium sp.]MCM1464254.1 DMT family transporter [Bacteroidales bacterium]